MSVGVAFWIVVIVGVLFGFLDYRGPADNHRWGYATWIVILVLVCLLGYTNYGWPIHR